ncbi:symporter small accessory protein [Methanosalsum natronophilum]
MLGIEDPQIWIAYFLCILSALGCMIYGGLKWNKGDDDEVVQKCQ